MFKHNIIVLVKSQKRVVYTVFERVAVSGRRWYGIRVRYTNRGGTR